MFQPFIQQGWDVTEARTRASVFATVRSSLFGRRYRTSPVSSLYLYGRPQDIALQKARNYTDDPYCTDGLRVVILPGADDQPFEALLQFPSPPWRDPIAPGEQTPATGAVERE